MSEGELRDVLMESNIEPMPPLEMGLTLRRWARERAGKEDRSTPCPECHQEMFRHEWKQSQVMVDRCLECQGLWLDGGEIDKLEQYDASLVAR